MNLVEYWKKRCELAEAYIKESPCDPDIYKKQLDAYNNWCEFKKLPIPVAVVPKGTLCKCGKQYEVYNKLEGTIVCTLCGKDRLA